MPGKDKDEKRQKSKPLKLGFGSSTKDQSESKPKDQSPPKDPPKRTGTDTSTKSTSSKGGKRSPIPSPKEFFAGAKKLSGGMSVTPSMRTGGRQKKAKDKEGVKAAPYPEEGDDDEDDEDEDSMRYKTPKPPLTAKKEAKKFSSMDAVVEDVEIPIVAGLGDLDRAVDESMVFAIPYDRSGHEYACYWKNSEWYTIREINDWPHARNHYLTGFLPPKPDATFEKKDLHIVFRIMSVVENVTDQVAKDAKTSLQNIVWMRKWVNITVHLMFDGDKDERLHTQKAADTALNIFRILIMDLQAENRAGLQHKGKSTPRQHEYAMSGALGEKTSGFGEIDPLTATMDFADGSSLVHGEIVRPSMQKNSDAEEWQKAALIARDPPQERHIRKGDERDDAITPAPRKF